MLDAGMRRAVVVSALAHAVAGDRAIVAFLRDAGIEASARHGLVIRGARVSDAAIRDAAPGR